MGRAVAPHLFYGFARDASPANTIQNHKIGAGRKVRAGQGTVMANGHRGQPQGKCHRNYTADPAPTLGIDGLMDIEGR